MIIKDSIIPKLCSWFFEVEAITLWPFIFCRGEPDHILLNHEKIHLVQMKETFVIGFYIIYLYEFLRNWKKYKNTDTAYMLIRFERECYDNQHYADYLKTRKKYTWKAIK